MKILVFEYITGGGLARESLPQSLAREGDLMLRSLLADLGEIEGIQLSVMRDSRLGRPRSDQTGRVDELLPVTPDDDLDRVWKAALRQADAVWPIAPETDGILEKLCMDIRVAGKRNLASPAEAVALTSSKLETLRHLAKSGIEVVPSLPLGEFRGQFSGALVVKPDDGAGCEGSRILRSNRDLQVLFDGMATAGKSLIIQPLLEGIPMSLSILFRQGEALLLSCNRQNIVVQNDRFILSGCTVNIGAKSPEIFSKLAASIARSIPELFGYAGVDLIFAEDGPKVLEINPRLTTSYAGLSRALQRNVAAMVLDLLSDRSPFPESLQIPGFSVDVRCGEQYAT